MPYALRDDLYCCIANDQTTFLDLKADRYFGLPEELDSTFQTWLMANKAGLNDQYVSERLITSGILTETTASVAFHQPRLPNVTRSALDLHPDQKRKNVPLSAFLHQHKAARRLTSKSLWATIERLQSRKLKRISSFPEKSENEFLPWVHVFLRSGRLIYTQDQCLRRSLALIDYLAGKGCFPSFVMGVRRQPFGAHAWVQHDDMVLNDLVDHVTEYAPILAV